MSAAAAKNVEATTLRAGIVGAGVFGGYHAQKYDALGGVALTSIFDTDIGRAKALADRFGVTFYTDYSLFLKSVDLVSITSPATTHFDMARAAISGGKHCLVEKPIALEATHATALIEQATQADVCLQVGHQERFVANAAKLFKDAENVDDVAWRRCGVGTGRRKRSCSGNSGSRNCTGREVSSSHCESAKGGLAPGGPGYKLGPSCPHLGWARGLCGR